ncbi:hypothetical protein CHS0354_033164 [Potamilus streckersoni]|uniref:C-type lectin domain-containing protein n=1 Tax=Potamilus streckersoni TaxID=2493646 RepID=A0AAE0VR12_9BIVA|nr:hypothetical protein CHS0354_033164 [Potamilus streckersoni]
MIWCVWLVLLTFAEGEEYEKCPQVVRNSRHYFKTFNKTCYMFVNEEKFWDDARDYCWSQGGELVKIPNMETMTFLIGVLNSHELGWDSNGVWNGASDLRNRGWEWTTGEKLTWGFWDRGQPSKTFFISLENCALMRRGHGWRWHDYHCHILKFHFNFICQFPFVAPNIQGDREASSAFEPDGKVDERGIIIGLVIAGTLVILVLAIAMLILYRKRQLQKARAEEVTDRCDNLSYRIVPQSDYEQQRPVSNIYLEPGEVTRLYEEIQKTVDYSEVNLNNNQSEQAHFSDGASVDEIPTSTCEGMYITCDKVENVDTAMISSAMSENSYVDMSVTSVSSDGMSSITGVKDTNLYVQPQIGDAACLNLSQEDHVYSNIAEVENLKEVDRCDSKIKGC